MNSTSPNVEQLTSLEFNFYLISGILGAILNVLVLFVAFRYTDTYDKPRQIVVINMTVSDLITCLVYMITRPYLREFNEFFCFPYYVVIFTSQMSSCLNLLWLNVDKLIYIKFPLHYYSIVHRSRVIVISVISWLCIFVVALFIYSFMSIMQPCSGVSLPPFLYSGICLFYITIISVSFIISAVIYLIARKARRNEPQAGSRMFQRLFFVFSSTMWTFLTCLPYRLLYLGFLMFPVARESSTLQGATSAFFVVVVIGIVFNPLITIITQGLYREGMIRIFFNLTNFFCCGKMNCCEVDESYARRKSRPSIAERRSCRLDSGNAGKPPQPQPV